MKAKRAQRTKPEKEGQKLKPKYVGMHACNGDVEIEDITDNGVAYQIRSFFCKHCHRWNMSLCYPYSFIYLPSDFNLKK